MLPSKMQRSPMQSTHIQLCKMVVPAIFNGKGALACLAVSSMESRPLRKWKPLDGWDSLGKILKEGLGRSCNSVKDAIEMTPAFHPVA